MITNKRCDYNITVYWKKTKRWPKGIPVPVRCRKQAVVKQLWKCSCGEVRFYRYLCDKHQ